MKNLPSKNKIKQFKKLFNPIVLLFQFLGFSFGCNYYKKIEKIPENLKIFWYEKDFGYIVNKYNEKILITPIEKYKDHNRQTYFLLYETYKVKKEILNHLEVEYE